MALLLAGNGIATFPWEDLTLVPKEFADQGVVFVLAVPGVPGVLGMYLVNGRRLEERRLVEQAN